MSNPSVAVEVARLWAPQNLKKCAPGILLCCAIAAIAFVANANGWMKFGRVMIPPLIVTLVIGMCLQPLSSRDVLKPGLDFSGRTLLRLGVALEPERVGGDRQLDMVAERAGAPHDVDEATPDQRLTAGEPDLLDAETAYADLDQPHDLVVGEDLGVRQPVETLGRHAVGAAQVAAVRQRHPQVGRDAAVRVGKGSLVAHPASLRVPAP